MSKRVRDRIDSRGRQPDDGGRKAGDASQASAADNAVPERGKAPPDRHTCFFCAYACLMPRGRSFLMGMNLRRPLVCLNHPDAPGAFREVLGNSTCANFRARPEPPLRVQPPEPPNDQVKFIALTRGQHVMVDAADFPRLNKHKWCAVPCSNGSGYYAMRNTRGGSIFMHREIVNAKEGEVVDHANRLPWDNRRCNLRPCSQEESNRNRHASRVHSSRFQGVSYDRRWGKWVGFVRAEGRLECIAASNEEVEAARLRDRWAFACYDRFAFLNFPEDFVGKDPADLEFQALRDQLAEKRRKREARKKAREERRKAQGKSKKAKGKGKKAGCKRRGRRGDRLEDGEQTTEGGSTR